MKSWYYLNNVNYPRDNIFTHFLSNRDRLLLKKSISLFIMYKDKLFREEKRIEDKTIKNIRNLSELKKMNQSNTG